MSIIYKVALETYHNYHNIINFSWSGSKYNKWNSLYLRFSELYSLSKCTLIPYLQELLVQFTNCLIHQQLVMTDMLLWHKCFLLLHIKKKKTTWIEINEIIYCNSRYKNSNCISLKIIFLTFGLSTEIEMHIVCQQISDGAVILWEFLKLFLLCQYFTVFNHQGCSQTSAREAEGQTQWIETYGFSSSSPA